MKSSGPRLGRWAGAVPGRWACIAALGLPACGGSEAADAPADAAALSCFAELALVGGRACAVVPSQTKAGIDDALGYHAVGIPEGADASTPVFLFLRGGAGIPYDQYFARTTGAWAGLGLVVDQHYRVLTDTTDDGHGFVASEAVSAVAGRAWACFE